MNRFALAKVSGALLVVVLVQALERAAIDEQRLEARLRAGHGCQGSDSQVYRSDERGINCRLLFRFLLDDLHHLSIQAWDNADLINGVPFHLRLNFAGQP